MQLSGAEPTGRDGLTDSGAGAPACSAAEIVAGARATPGGVLFQTTHWREQARRQAAVVGAVLLFFFVGSALDGENVVVSALIGGLLMALVVAIGSVRLRYAGLLVTPDGVFARTALGRPEPIETASLLEQKPARTTTIAAGPSDLLGFLLPPHRWRFVPGLRARGAVAPFGTGLLPVLTRLLVGDASKLTSRPLRPWYRLPARTTVHHDVVWDTRDGGRALQAVLGFGPPLAPAVDAAGERNATAADASTLAASLDQRFETHVLKASGRVRVSAIHAPAVMAAAAATLLLITLAKLQVVIEYDRVETIAIALVLYLSLMVGGMTVFLTRSVTVTTEGLLVRNGPAAAQRVAWADAHGLTIVGPGRRPLQLDTSAGPVRLKGMVFSDRPTVLTRLAPQAVEWACSPYGVGRRTVGSSKEAVVLLEALFRSRGWQQPDDWVAPPVVVGRVDATATRLERWNRAA